MSRRFRLYLHPSIYELAPSYMGIVMYVDGIQNGPSDDWSEALLSSAERATTTSPVSAEQHPHMCAWADVYRAFGARPKNYKNGCLALASRPHVPRINALVDAYNAIALKHMIPIGGEDWDSLQSDLLRTRARGHEVFFGNEAHSRAETAAPGEPIWLDAAGVTTRRFNWRQARRTRITHETRAAYFVLDALAPYSQVQLQVGAQDLQCALRARWPNAVIETVVL